MLKIRKTKKLMGKARELLKRIPRTKGEIRSIRVCLECGHLYAHVYIPFAIGVGVYSKRCLCQLTSNHTQSMTLITTKRGM